MITELKLTKKWDDGSYMGYVYNWESKEQMKASANTMINELINESNKDAKAGSQILEITIKAIE